MKDASKSIEQMKKPTSQPINRVTIIKKTDDAIIVFSSENGSIPWEEGGRGRDLKDLWTKFGFGRRNRKGETEAERRANKTLLKPSCFSKRLHSEGMPRSYALEKLDLSIFTQRECESEPKGCILRLIAGLWFSPLSENMNSSFSAIISNENYYTEDVLSFFFL